MTRPFGMIVTSIWGSQRFHALPDDTCRLGYLYLHTNDHRNSLGCFRLPPDYLAADLRIDVEKARYILHEIEAQGLVDYDPVNLVVRIAKWFPHNAINSPKHLAGAVSHFERLPSGVEFLGDLAFEIVMSAFVKSDELERRGRSQVSTGKTERAKASGHVNLESAATMNELMLGLIDTLTLDQEAVFLRRCAASRDRLTERVISTFEIDLSRAPNRPMDTPIDTPIHTPLPTETETETETDTETETETETGDAAPNAQKKGKTVPPDLQADIETLTRKAGRARA